jgi:hypothetical protein
MTQYPYRYNFRLRELHNGQDSPLFGKRCRVIARAGSNKNARMVEFQDGTVHIVAGNALRKVDAKPKPRKPSKQYLNVAVVPTEKELAVRYGLVKPKAKLAEPDSITARDMAGINEYLKRKPKNYNYEQWL